MSLLTRLGTALLALQGAFASTSRQGNYDCELSISTTEMKDIIDRCEREIRCSLFPGAFLSFLAGGSPLPLIVNSVACMGSESSRRKNDCIERHSKELQSKKEEVCSAISSFRARAKV